MNTMQKWLVSGFIALSLVLSFAAFNREAEQVVQQVVGGGGGSELMTNWFGFGGVRSWAYHMSFRTATTSVCALQSPTSTTTLVSATADFASTPNYATVYEMGWDKTAYSTTTALGTTEFSLAAKGTATLVASSSTTMLGQLGVVPPSTWINLRLSTTTTSATFAPTGSCNAVFREVN